MSKLHGSWAASVLLLHLAVCASAAAQHTQGYVSGGAATVTNNPYTYWQGNYTPFAGGGEGAIGRRFTLAGEGAGLISTAGGYNAGVLSAGPNFHFLLRSDRKIDPFVGGRPSRAGRGVAEQAKLPDHKPLAGREASEATPRYGRSDRIKASRASFRWSCVISSESATNFAF